MSVDFIQCSDTSKIYNETSILTNDVNYILLLGSYIYITKHNTNNTGLVAAKYA